MKNRKIIRKLKGANMDIDLASQKDVEWKQDKCPWNKKDGKNHRCAVKSTLICKYFCGIEYPDMVLCYYPDKK